MKNGIKIFVILLVLSQSACAIKKLTAWPPSVEFNEGLDFHIGTNGISDVSDSRGIGNKPKPLTKGVTTASDNY